MDIVTALVAGGVVYAGVSAYRKHRQRRTTVWLLENGHAVKSSAVVVEEPDLQHIERRVDFNLNIATWSLVLTTAGVLVYSPLLLISIPLNIYDAIAMFEDAWSVFIEKRRITAVVIIPSLVAVTMVIELYLLTSVVQWLYFLNQKLTLVLLRSDLAPLMQQWQPDEFRGAYTV